jgi:hypothetical protein
MFNSKTIILPRQTQDKLKKRAAFRAGRMVRTSGGLTVRAVRSTRLAPQTQTEGNGCRRTRWAFFAAPFSGWFDLKNRSITKTGLGQTNFSARLYSLLCRCHRRCLPCWRCFLRRCGPYCRCVWNRTASATQNFLVRKPIMFSKTASGQTKRQGS